MGKTRKSKPKFKHSINRRRVNKRNKTVGNFSSIGTIVKKSWEEKTTLRRNMDKMGLAFDPNEVLPIPTAKETLMKLMSDKPEESGMEPEITKPGKSKSDVVDELEAFAKLPREKKFALPQSQVQLLTYLLDKYGEDYKAMARDRKNIYQETWKQLQAKVKLFKKVPHQWEEYLRHRKEVEAASEDI